MPLGTSLPIFHDLVLGNARSLASARKQGFIVKRVRKTAVDEIGHFHGHPGRRRGATMSVDSLDRREVARSPRLDSPPLAPSHAGASGRAGRPADVCELSLVADRAEFDALQDEWNALFAHAGRPQQLFQTYDWLRHWANHYLNARTRLSIVVARRDECLVMIWPLVATRSAGLTRLCWMGEPVSQYGDVLVEDGPSQFDLLRRGWAYVKSLDADLIHLRKTRADSVVFPLLTQEGALSIASAAAPYVDLAAIPGGETPERRYSAKKRTRRRSLLRSLHEAATVRFENHQRGPAARDLVEHALMLKQKWLRRRGVIAPVLQDNRFGRFLRDVAAAANGAPDMCVYAVRCNGGPAAVEVSLACKGHALGYLISYDTELARHGIGLIVAEYSMRTAHEQGFVRFDLLTPADPYKMDWADACVEVRDWALPLSPGGKLYAEIWLNHIHKWMKDITKRLPLRLRRRLAGLYRLAHPPEVGGL
jgi:CelD/BcsL family acetyltransferase involved in cellulose biosynthesis